MADFLSPENRVTEIRKGPVSITPSGSGLVAAFVGVASKGPGKGLHPATPQLVVSETDFYNVFGESRSDSDLYASVKAFFDNAKVGAQAYVSRAVHYTTPATPSTYDAVAGTLQLQDGTPTNTVLLTASSVGAWSRQNKITTRRRSATLTTVAALLAGSTAATGGVETGTNAAPWNLGAGGGLAVSINGGGAVTGTFTGAAATVVSTLVPTYAAVVALNELHLTRDGAPMVVVFSGAEVTQADFHATINAVVAATASNSAGVTRLTAGILGTAGNITVLGTSDADVLTSLGFVAAATATGTGNVANLATVSTAEYISIMGAAVGVTAAATVTGGNLAVMTSATLGVGGTVQFTAGAVATAFGFDAILHAGTAAVTVNATTAQLTSTSRVAKGDLLRLGASMYVTVTSISSPFITFASTAVPVGGVAVSAAVLGLTWDLTTLNADGSTERNYTDLRMSALSLRYFHTVIDSGYRPMVVTTDNASASADPRPADITAQALASGTDGSSVVDADLIGSSVGKTGIYAYDRTEGFGMFAVPGCSATVAQAVLAYADTRQRFLAVIDTPAGADRDACVTFVNTTVNVYTSYGTVIAPRLWVLDPSGSGARRLIPPSGAWMGIMAKVHSKRGAWKAPAGPEDGALVGVLEPEFVFSKSDYDVMYPERVNVIQPVQGYGICVMGNKTLDPTGEVIEVGVRRSLLHIAVSVEAGTRWVQFEDANENTWAKMRRVIRTFLRTYWDNGNGGLYGKKESDAFFIICDESNNTPDVRAARKIKTRIGVAVVHAGEFIDTTLEQDTRAFDAASAG